MIFFTEELIKNHEKFNMLLDYEKKILSSMLDVQNIKKETISKYLDKFQKNNSTPEIVNFLKETLEVSNSNIAILNKLNLLLTILTNAIKENNMNSLTEEKINNFNSTFSEAYSTVQLNTLQIEKALNQFSDQNINIKLELTEADPIVDFEELKNNLPEDLKRENTLVISETKQTVFLPYTYHELEQIFSANKNKFSSYEEIIQTHYTIPLSFFKNASISRFKEAFKLIKNKENLSTKDGLELGVELFFNYNLHPAIIAACRNIDELDIYLDYLDNNEMYKFDCFNIVFEVSPTVISSKPIPKRRTNNKI